MSLWPQINCLDSIQLPFDLLSFDMPRFWTKPPYTLRDVRDSMVQSTADSWVFWAILAAALTCLALMAIYAWRHEPHRPVAKNSSDPDRLFESLLAKLDLTDKQKSTLHTMAHAGRLRHPVQCLLSPNLLDWSRKLWINEKDPKAADPDNIRRIDEVAVELYDHRPPDDDEQLACELTTTATYGTKLSN